MTVKHFLNKNAPSIFAGMAIAGVVETVVLAVKATPKAYSILEEMEEEPTKVEVVKATWKCYMPAAVAGVATIACITASHYAHIHKETGLIAAYSLAETKFANYRKKVGRKKDKDVMNKLQKEKIKKAKKPKEEPVDGKMWCYEPESDQFFQATTEQILWVELTANKVFANQSYLTFNQFLSLLPGCKKVEWGDHYGWYLYDEDGTWDFNWSFYRGGSPWIDIQPQISVDEDMMILAYGMHPGDDLDCNDIDEPEQFIVQNSIDWNKPKHGI